MRNFHHPGRSVTYADNGMAATSSPQASLAAIDVLRQGGNAVDAAVTASAVLCITEPHMTGIGGDCFALIGTSDGEVMGLNASGRAAKRANADWLKGAALSEIAVDSVHAITVPGAIDGWAKLLERFGTMDLGTALQPAIKLAHEGVPTMPRVARDWALETDRLIRDEGARQHLLIDGRAPEEGERMQYPALARTLEAIAAKGRDGFYTGEVAQDICAMLAKRGGLLEMDDFAATEASWVTPIAAEFCGRELLEIPPNGQGITALIALNILDRFDLQNYAPDSAERRHLEVEAVRLAWVMRDRHIADPDFAVVPVDEMLSQGMIDYLAGLIKLDKAIIDPALEIKKPASDTVYLTVVDKDRLSISFINSVFHGFGSGLVTPKTGIALQNRGSGFTTDPAHPNCIGPGKRPLHTIIPGMVRYQGRIESPFGVMGGSYQPMGHVAMMVNRFIYGMNPQQALDFPRAFHEHGVLGIEDGISDAVRDRLRGWGHKVERVESPWGGGQIIIIDHDRGCLIGGSDPRKDGVALGY